MSSLKLQDVKKRFGITEIIRGVNLNISAGEFVVFVGPSGCGKSTLLRMIAGLEEATEGAITIGDMDVTNAAASERNVAMVFQSYALYPHMTVLQNLTFGMRMRGVDKSTIAQKIERAVSILQLQPYLDRKPGELSGGQCQRVAIGRAIVQEPAIFLFDEPLSNLDAELRLKMRVEISALHKTLGKTMVYVTHDQVEAMTLADKIVVLRDGVIEQVGAPLQLYTNPCNEFVAGFLGSPAMNFIDAEISGINADNHAALKLVDKNSVNAEIISGASSVAVDVKIGRCKIGVRPEHIEIADDGVHVATVSVIERLGAVTFIYAAFEGQTICIEERLDTRLQKIPKAPKVGEAIRFNLPAERIYVFSNDGKTITKPKLFS